MFVIKITDDNERFFFFAGWDGSDTDPAGGQLTYWKEDYKNPEVYEFDSLEEASIELEILLTNGPEFTIGLPEDFDVGIALINLGKVREVL